MILQQQQHQQVNMYFNEYFNGEEEYSYVDKPQLNYDNRALSLIGDMKIWSSLVNNKLDIYVIKYQLNCGNRALSLIGDLVIWWSIIIDEW